MGIKSLTGLRQRYPKIFFLPVFWFDYVVCNGLISFSYVIVSCKLCWWSTSESSNGHICVVSAYSSLSSQVRLVLFTQHNSSSSAKSFNQNLTPVFFLIPREQFSLHSVSFLNNCSLVDYCLSTSILSDLHFSRKIWTCHVYNVHLLPLSPGLLVFGTPLVLATKLLLGHS